MKPAFSFYEVVTVNIASEKVHCTKEGAILGMAQDDKGHWVYAVEFFDETQGCDYPEDQLMSTGKIMTRNDFYDGDNIIV